MNKIFNILLIICLLILYKVNIYAQMYVPQNNLLSNSDFMNRDPQQHPLNWVMGRGLHTITISGKQKHGTRTDDQSVEFADSSAKIDASLKSKKIMVNPGSMYVSHIWAKIKSGNPAAFHMEFWNQHNKTIGHQSITPENVTDWQKLELRMKAPDSCTHVTVSIVSSVSNIGISYWDDALLYVEQSYNPNLKKGVRELFMDDYRIQQMVDVQRIVKPGEKSKVLIEPTEPWEGTSTYLYGTVLINEPAGTGYRMWYGTYLKEKYYMCYATSKDGINWVKPKLGVFEFNGSKENNICREGGGTLVYDPRDPDPAKRYKLMAFDPSKQFFGYNVYFSPDGFKWTHGVGKPVLPYGDVSNITYDKEKQLFIATTKQRMLISNTSVTPGKMDRAAFVSVSKDFIKWTAPDEPNSAWTLAVEGDERDDLLVRSKGGIEANIYGMTVYPYQGVYIGFPWMFDIMTYANGEFANTGDGVIQPQLAMSRDLRHWNRLVREPIIPVGKAGAWDDGTLYTSTSMHISDKEMYIYYGAMNLPHGGSTKTQTQYARIAKASWRRDGMMALYNEGDDQGIITTKALKFEGSKLKLNTKLKKGGALKVEILDENGTPINGYTFTEGKLIQNDHYEVIVNWNKGSDLSHLQGKTIKLRFQLSAGELYSYWFD